ncbi:hypothetical protein PFISCL1PPCAC_17804, partial [Pristionchus fissidentatus]
EMRLLPLLVACISVAAAGLTDADRQEMAEILPAMRMMLDDSNIKRMMQTEHQAMTDFMDSVYKNNFDRLEQDLEKLKSASEHVFSVLSPLFKYLKERYDRLETKEAKTFMHQRIFCFFPSKFIMILQLPSIADAFNNLSDRAKTDLFQRFAEIFALIEKKQRLMGRVNGRN